MLREGLVMAIRICDAATGAVLAAGDEGDSSAVRYEGNVYFTSQCVDGTSLRVSERTYTCSYKGTCNWVDLVRPDGTVARDVGWVYAETKPGHEMIRGRYGFYAGSRGVTREERD
jgi:uncharacterized protein (DUF427 family)